MLMRLMKAHLVKRQMIFLLPHRQRYTYVCLLDWFLFCKALPLTQRRSFSCTRINYYKRQSKNRTGKLRETVLCYPLWRHIFCTVVSLETCGWKRRERSSLLGVTWLWSSQVGTWHWWELGCWSCFNRVAKVAWASCSPYLSSPPQLLSKGSDSGWLQAIFWPLSIFFSVSTKVVWVCVTFISGSITGCPWFTR